MTTKTKDFHTYFAPLPSDPTGRQVELGRGNPDDPNSNASDAIASVESTDPEVHEAILQSLDQASEGQPIARDNAAQVLGRAVELSRTVRNSEK